MGTIRAKGRQSNSLLISTLGMALMLVGIPTPAYTAADIQIVETTATVSSVAPIGEIWRGVIPTSVVLLQGSSYGDLKFSIQGSLPHKILADRALGAKVEFELWSSAGKKIAYDTVYSSDWNPIGPNTLVSMYIYERDLAAGATYTLLIRTLYETSTTGLLTRYLEDKKTLNFKITQAKLPSKVTLSNTAYGVYQISDSEGSSRYEIGFRLSNSNVTTKECSRLSSSSYSEPIAVKTVTDPRFSLTEDEKYEIAKRVGASLGLPYVIVARGVNEFGSGEWSNGFCSNKFDIPAAKPSTATSSSSTATSTGSSSTTTVEFDILCSTIDEKLAKLVDDSNNLNEEIETFNNKYLQNLEYFNWDFFPEVDQTCIDSTSARDIAADLDNALAEFSELNKRFRKAVLSVKSITCTKGKVKKKIVNLNPKCPAGYKKK
jgi:hypothetical protein